MIKTRQPTLKAAILPFVCVIVMQMLFAGFSVNILSAVRADVIAQSLWSKQQQQASYYISLYLNTGDEENFRRYKGAMTMLLVMRDVRLTIEASDIDMERARAGLIKLGSHPDDIPNMVRTFTWVHGLSYVETAFRKWAQTDALFLQMDRLAEAIHAEDPLTISAMSRLAKLKQIEANNAEVVPLGIAFSEALDEVAKLTEYVLMTANFVLALVLVVLTVWRVQRFLKQRRAAENALSWQASHDSLTGLANRLALESRLGRAMTADPRPPSALIFLDLDQFKIINDTCGHTAGDSLLKRICGPLQNLLSEGDLLARLGGDEFSILLTNCSMVRAISVAENLRLAVQNLDFVWDRRGFKIAASIGLAHTDQGLMTSQEMMRAADMACFMAKEKGRDRVHVHRAEDEDLRRHAGEMNWVQRIHQALDENRFCLFAQEIAPLALGETGTHVELLIRLCDESGAIIPPGSFLPAAERFGLMPLIDRWVVKAAFDTLAARLDVAKADPISCCAINLSGATIGDDSFLNFLGAMFASSGIPPQMICFEITETSAITNLEAAKTFINDLRTLGCRFSLDDFGAGMSSFGYLKHLAVDYIKIDGSFVKNLLNDPVDRAMVETINHIGHVMGKKIIAEFAESEALVEALGAIGVDYGQGYAIAKPKPFDLAFRSEASRRKTVERSTRNAPLCLTGDGSDKAHEACC